MLAVWMACSQLRMAMAMEAQLWHVCLHQYARVCPLAAAWRSPFFFQLNPRVDGRAQKRFARSDEPKYRRSKVLF